MTSLVLTTDAHESLLTHAEEGRAPPREVCGVLSGRRAGEDASGADRVTGVHPVPNVASDPRAAYELDPEETLATVERVEDAGDDVVGFYHTHPEGPDRPSETDRRQATWADHVYCIVSLADESSRVGAWRWTGEAFDPLGVEVR